MGLRVRRHRPSGSKFRGGRSVTTRTKGGIFSRYMGIIAAAMVAMGFIAFALGYLIHPAM